QVPLGKLHTERWVPVDQEARAVVARLSFLRTLPPSAGEFLLPVRRAARTSSPDCARLCVAPGPRLA
ncbi:MAG: hypothetical protein ACR2NN_19015, partial [Bryobacteraceae bacterium]